jgi:hypothetical protein
MRPQHHTCYLRFMIEEIQHYLIKRLIELRNEPETAEKNIRISELAVLQQFLLDKLLAASKHH